MATPSMEGHRIVDTTSDVIYDLAADDNGEHAQLAGASQPANNIQRSSELQPNHHHGNNDPDPHQAHRSITNQKKSAEWKFVAAIIIVLIVLAIIIFSIGIFVWSCTMVHSTQNESFLTQLIPIQNDSVASNYSIIHGNTIQSIGAGMVTLSTNTEATLSIAKKVKTVQKEKKMQNLSFSEFARSFYSEGNVSFEAELALIGESEVFVIFRLTRCDIHGKCFESPDQVEFIRPGKTISLRNTYSNKGYYDLSMTVGPFGNKTNIVWSQLRYNVVDPNQMYDRSCTTGINQTKCRLSIPSTEEYSIVTTFRNDQKGSYSISQDGFTLLGIVLGPLTLVTVLLLLTLLCVMIWYSIRTFKRIKELKQQLAPQQETSHLL